jgi:fermentation-respiration switch protein FrsA (DUF1100 family)
MSNTSTKPPRTWRRRLLRWAVLLALLYLGVVAVMLALENWLLYHPSGPDDWLPPPAGVVVEDIALTSADGTPLHAWWFPRRRAQVAMLCFHGNGGNVSWNGPALAHLSAELGVAVLAVEYPGYGKSGGSPSEAGCYGAADAGYQWLIDNRQFSGDRILIWGESLGGGVAVDLASRKPHRALILVKTFTSAPDVGQSVYPWLPVRWLMRNRFDSLAKLDKCRQPIFIAHGTADKLIPFAHGEKLYEAAHEPKQFLRLEGVGHNDGLPPQFLVELKAFLARTVPLAAPAGK